MRIEVKHNDPIKAYKFLMKKLTKDGFFKEVGRSRYFMSNQEKKRQRDKESFIRHKKAEEKRKRIYEKEEQRQLVDSKKRAKEIKKFQQYNKNNKK